MIGHRPDRAGVALFCAATAALLASTALADELPSPPTGAPPAVAAVPPVRVRRAPHRRVSRRVATRRPAPPPRVEITLDPGVTLVDVAHTYHVSVSRIISANRIREPRSLHAGRKLVIPGATKIRPLRRRPECKSPAVELLRVATDERARVALTRCNGQPDPAGVERLSQLARSLRADVSLELAPRLAQMLQKVASRFPGRRIEVISGYRPHPPGREGISNHTRGKAIDFRIAGISNEVLRDFCRATFADAGVGYYPNSVFVHLDVRERGSGKAFWVDYSRPGEPPQYGPLRPEHSADPHELADLERAPRRTATRRRTRL